MSAPDINTIAEIIATVLEISDASEIDEFSSAATLEGWDSLKHMNIVISLEQTFGVKFEDSEIPTLMSIGVIRDAIQAKL